MGGEAAAGAREQETELDSVEIPQNRQWNLPKMAAPECETERNLERHAALKVGGSKQCDRCYRFLEEKPLQHVIIPSGTPVRFFRDGIHLGAQGYRPAKKNGSLVLVFEFDEDE